MKGQIFSFDMVISITLFIISLLVLYSVFSTISSEIIEKDIIEDAYEKANLVIEKAIRFPGIPNNWDSSTVEVIGLANKEYFLNRTKIERFNETSYNKLKCVFGGYDFYFRIEYMNDTIVLEKGHSIENKSAVKVLRYAVFDNKMVKLILEFYF